VILVADRLGQLGNRLFQFAHLVAFGVEHRTPVANPGFQEYASDFPVFAGDALCRWPPGRVPLPPRSSRLVQRQTEWLRALLQRAGGGVGPVRSIAVDHDDEAALERFRREALRRPLLLVAGWGVRDELAFRRHADLLRGVFTPAARRQRAARDAVAVARRGADLVVGLHVRRGDYARYAGGRYFWPLRDYATLAERARALGSGRRVAVLACSDDPAARAELGDLVTPGPGHPVEDVTALSECDLVLGPPSTFSAWAAFHGRVPLRHLEAPGDPLAVEDFRPPPA
jgi:hypothetical protein